MQLAAVARSMFGRTIMSRLLFGSLLFLLIIVSRWAWIDCDGGTPTLTEYGYFQTDEGFYAGGGKRKFVYDQFITVLRAAPCTYAICPSTHVMTWAAFEIFGQTTWAHRVFPLLISTGAWLALFYFLSRKTLPWIAFLLCTVCLLNPVLTVYGRTACSDTLMASVLLIGYVVTRKKGNISSFMGGAVFGLGLWVKPSVWVLFPLGLSAAAMSTSPKDRWRRMLYCGLGFIVSMCIQYALIRLMIYEDARAQNTPVDQLLEIADSSYPLPNPFDWDLTFRGLSSFPRCPADGMLSVWIALFLVLPGLLLLRRLTDTPRLWDGRLLLYLTLLLYTAGLIILPVFYSHYYIPLMVFVPIVWFESRRDLKLWASRKPLLGVALMAGVILCAVFSLRSFVVYPDEAKGLADYLSNAYNLPPQIVWHRNGEYILAFAGLLFLLGLCARLRKPTGWALIGVLLSALGVADLCFSKIPLTEAYKYTTLFNATIKDVAYILQVACILLFFVVWGLPGLFRKSVRWHLFLAVFFGCATLANPVWRNGAKELTQRGYLHKKAVSELAKLVPDNGVVFGERAPQLFLSLKPRVSPMPNADPVPTVFKVHEKFPERPLFALLDSEHNYHYMHYMNNTNRIRMEVVRKLTLPSFNNGLPSDAFLVRLHILDNQPRTGPFAR